MAPSEPVAPVSVFSSSADALAALRADIGPDCSRCKLHTLGRRQVVFGVGNPDADLMFVGEAPGADEDVQGEPFVGRAGQLLTKIIEAIELRREDVYIANVIKCRPPQNRNPEPDEVEQCEPFLFRQVDTVKPKVIVALGKFAAQCLLRTTEPITRIRGKEFTYRDAIGEKVEEGNRYGNRNERHVPLRISRTRCMSVHTSRLADGFRSR
jgi:uracil-DNA glycosylase family 4